jgi:hypothetical protein
LVGVVGRLLSTTVSSAGLTLLLGVLMPDGGASSSKSSGLASREMECKFEGTMVEAEELRSVVRFRGERPGERESGGGVLVTDRREEVGQ